MDKLKYNNLMKVLTERINQNLKDNKRQELYENLYYLLTAMYINEYNEKVNNGALFQLMGGNFDRLCARFFENRNLVLKFDEKRNELIFGDVFAAKINWCDVFDEQKIGILPNGMTKETGLQIVVKNSGINDSTLLGNDVDVFLLRGNTMWIEHKGPKQHGINHKPYQVKSYEQRTFDSYGIEMARTINTEFTLGITAFPDALIGNEYLTEVGTVSNITKVHRDPVYFQMAKIEVLQKNIGITENSQVKYLHGVLNAPTSCFDVKTELYGLCPAEFSLDINQTTDTFEEGLNICKGVRYLNVENQNADRFFQALYPKPFFQHLQAEVEKRKKIAREACKKYFESKNKKI